MVFLYLSLNLLLYNTADNGLFLKLWGIKSCIFAAMSVYLSMRYSLQMCELSDYRDKNRIIQTELVQKKTEEENLRLEAFHDLLTGCYNRQYAMEAVAGLLKEHKRFTLCFADLDGLKTVNDQYGHGTGDLYLSLIHIFFRAIWRCCFSFARSFFSLR